MCRAWYRWTPLSPRTASHARTYRVSGCRMMRTNVWPGRFMVGDYTRRPGAWRMAESHTLLTKLRQALRPTGALAGGAVVAVSGGPDSVALLRALAATVRGPLVVAHLNHGL